MTITHWMQRASQWCGVALRDDEHAITYPELLSRVKRLSAELRDRSEGVIALHGDNCVDWVLMDLAAALADVVLVPVPPFFTPQQVTHLLHSAGVELQIWLQQDGGKDGLEGLLQGCRLQTMPAPTQSTFPQGTGKITYTSGSTGMPKGVCLSTGHQWQVAQSLADALRLTEPTHFCTLPLAALLENVGGVYVPLLLGGEVICWGAKRRGLAGSSGLDVATWLAALSATPPNSLILTPQFVLALMAAVRQGWQVPASLQFIAVGGARVEADMVVSARQLGLPIYEGYGLSECCSVVSVNRPGRDAPGTAGYVLPHCQVSLCDGELLVQGSSFLGYVGDPASWFPETVVTGDLAELQDDGALIINGRKKNLIVTSFGRNIAPEWPESVLFAKGMFAQVLVLGEARQQLVAVVAPLPGIVDADIQACLSGVNRMLPDYAQLQQYIVPTASEWLEFTTSNGRPRRPLAEKWLHENLADRSVQVN